MPFSSTKVQNEGLRSLKKDFIFDTGLEMEMIDIRWKTTENMKKRNGKSSAGEKKSEVGGDVCPTYEKM